MLWRYRPDALQNGSMAGSMSASSRRGAEVERAWMDAADAVPMTHGRLHYPFDWPSHVDQPVQFADIHHTPALSVILPSGDEAWLVTGYQDVRSLLVDARVSKDRQRPDMARMTAGGGPVKHFTNQVAMDPPEHTRMRRLIAKAFTAARVERLRPRIAAIVDELLDAMAAGDRPVELSTAFAHPLSIRVICELLGVPRRDWPRFTTVREPPWEYMADLIESKRRDPGDDLISSLIEVSDADDGRLSQDELLWWSTVLLLAGYETSAHQMLSAVVLLLSHPRQLAQLRDDTSLVAPAVEELLRHQVVGTSLSMLRYATEDIPLAGVTIPKGASVIPSLECANHDPAAFHDALALDITRSGPRQLTFSFGQHFCVGAPLARIELQLGLSGLLSRFPGLRLAEPVGALRRRADPFTQGFLSVPVTWSDVEAAA
jgi:cytochrome P450